MAGSPFSGPEYYSGTETNDVAWIRKFILKNANQKSRRIAQFEVERLEEIMERIERNTTIAPFHTTRKRTNQSELLKENEDLRRIISELNEKYLNVNNQNKRLVENTDTAPLRNEIGNTVEHNQIKVSNNGEDTLVLMIIAIPMMLIYMFDWTFWGSKICLGIGWVLFLLMGLASFVDD